jgi:4-hydroxybenzoate polyprenyltransferase
MAPLSDVTPLVSPRRTRWRSYLLLARVSNLPTVWSNVLAGSVVAAAGAPVDASGILQVAAAISLFYTGGMVLNDAFDEPFDRQARPERPIPRGDITRSEAFAAGGLCLVLGALLLPAGLPRWLGVGLGAAILVYDVSHKQNPVAPIVMGACRAFVYAIAGAAIASSVPAPVLAAAVAMWVYVVALTVVARLAGPKARWLVPLLIAGISVLDAVVIAVAASRSWPLALVAALGFPLTLVLQRWVPGD